MPVWERNDMHLCLNLPHVMQPIDTSLCWLGKSNLLEVLFTGM